MGVLEQIYQQHDLETGYRKNDGFDLTDMEFGQMKKAAQYDSSMTYSYSFLDSVVVVEQVLVVEVEQELNLLLCNHLLSGYCSHETKGGTREDLKINICKPILNYAFY